MISDFSAGPHTKALWDKAKLIIEKTENLPFLNKMVDGSLDPVSFVNYICQDSIYLTGYARAMSLLAAKTVNRDDARFWAQSSAQAITVEEGMHASLLADKSLAQAREQLQVNKGAIKASPTTLGYVSFLVATAATESYNIGVAGVLPCFWVYAHIGKVLVKRAGTLPAGHPYKTWIETYDSAEFDQETRKAIKILEDLLATANLADRERMEDVFLQACVYEWHFWATADALQGWEMMVAHP